MRVTENSVNSIVRYVFTRFVITILVSILLVLLIVYQGVDLAFVLAKTSTFSTLASLSLDVSSSAGNESSLSSIYSSGVDVYADILLQREKTDIYFLSYLGFIRKSDVVAEDSFNSEVEQLRSYRTMVDNKAVSGREMTKFYNCFVELILERLAKKEALFGDISRVGVGLYHLASLIEQKALRRSIFSVAVAEGYFDVEFKYAVMSQLFREEFHRQLIIYSNPDTEKLFEEYDDDESVRKAVLFVNRSMIAVLNKTDTLKMDLNPLDLYNNFSKEIEGLDIIRDFLLEKLNKLARKKVTRVTFVFVIFCIIMLLELFTNIWYFTITWSFIEAYGTIKKWPHFHAKFKSGSNGSGK